MSGSVTGTDMRHNEGDYDQPNVISSVAERLAKFGGSDDDSPTPEPEVENDLETENDDPTPDDSDLDSDDDDSLTQDDDSEEPEAEKQKPAIPDSVYRSVQHHGWKPEEISEFFEADPEKALRVFEKMHESANNLSRQFAQVGRTRMELDKRKQQPQEEPAPQPKDFIDVEALRRRDPDNELLPVIEGMNKALRDLTSQAKPQPQREEADPQPDLAVAQQIFTFLGADQMKTYQDFYGAAFNEAGMPDFEGRNLTPGQAANRKALLDDADAIWIGARMHGRELSVAEALGMAHNLLTENMRTEQVRKELTDKVKRRGKGITLRPSDSKKVPHRSDTGKPKSEKELETRTEKRLTDLRKKGGMA